LKIQRIQELQQRMKTKEIDAAIIMQPRDLYYYSGTSQPCNLIIPQKGDPLLLVRRAESFVRQETWISLYEKGGGTGRTLEHLQKSGFHKGVLGMELDVIPYALVNKMASAFDQFSLVDITPLILEQRMVKDPDEIQLIREATHRFDMAHQTILKTLRHGISEVELGSRIADVLIRNQTEQIIFIRRWDDWLQSMGTIASGENLVRISGHAHTVTGVGLGPALPWGPSNRLIQEGDLVVVDNPLNYRGYHSDNTRTYVVGKASRKQRNIYQDLLVLQDAALKQIRLGLPINELFEYTLDKVKDLGYEEYFQGYGASQGQYLGHGVGLELDEMPVVGPRTTLPLQAGMVLAVECKFIIPDFGAVFIEDTVVVQEDGSEIFSQEDRNLAEVS
jgi:Xaa-Pro aminopeptidase